MKILRQREAAEFLGMTQGTLANRHHRGLTYPRRMDFHGVPYYEEEDLRLFKEAYERVYAKKETPAGR